MKRMLIILLLVSGCAHQVYQPSDYEKERMTKACRTVLISNGYDPNDFSASVIDDRNVNAFMDGTTFIATRGLLWDASDEQLIAVMCHELAHYQLGHQSKRVLLSSSITAAFIAANAFIPGVGLLNLPANKTATNAYSREQEIDADKQAVRTLQMALPSKNAKQVYLDMLRWMARLSPDGGSDHPEWKAREEAISSL